MGNWRDELVEVVKSKEEREAEEAERQRKRLEEALEVADEAMKHALEGLRFAKDQFQSKKQPAKLKEGKGEHVLTLNDLSLSVSLARESAVLEVNFNEGRPREFDFAKDRHLSPKDVEDYVGRRAVELARTAQKTTPW